MVEGEQKEIGYKAGEEHVQEGGERGQKPGHSPALGLLWLFLARVTSVPLRTQGSSPRSSWMTTRGREAESPVRDNQVRDQPQLRTTNCPTDGRSQGFMGHRQCHLCNQENPQVAPQVRTHRNSSVVPVRRNVLAVPKEGY